MTHFHISILHVVASVDLTQAGIIFLQDDSFIIIIIKYEGITSIRKHYAQHLANYNVKTELEKSGNGCKSLSPQ